MPASAMMACDLLTAHAAELWTARQAVRGGTERARLTRLPRQALAREAEASEGAGRGGVHCCSARSPGGGAAPARARPPRPDVVLA